MPLSLTEVINVRSAELLSKEWCDLVFEGRNKGYGAYYIRSRTGVRYRRVILILLMTFFLLAGLGTGFYLYARSVIKEKIKETEAALQEMRRNDHKEGYKLKFLSTARMMPSIKVTPGAVQVAPEIVDRAERVSRIFGVDGPIAFDPEEELITTPLVDTTGLSHADLPIAKQKIVPTEVISQVPEFPGGPRSFMRWLDENIVYPRVCLDRKQEGTLVVSFIVGADGYPIDFEIKDSFDSLVQRVVMNALKRMPRWRPGTDELGRPTLCKDHCSS